MAIVAHKSLITLVKSLKSLITRKTLLSTMEKSLKPDEFTGKFYQTFKDITSIFLKLFSKIEENKTLPNSFYNVSITQIQKSEKDTTRKENYRVVSLMNTDAKVLKILVN